MTAYIGGEMMFAKVFMNREISIYVYGGLIENTAERQRGVARRCQEWCEDSMLIIISHTICQVWKEAVRPSKRSKFPTTWRWCYHVFQLTLVQSNLCLLIVWLWLTLPISKALFRNMSVDMELSQTSTCIDLRSLLPTSRNESFRVPRALCISHSRYFDLRMMQGPY